jgi:hypothetical protein
VTNRTVAAVQLLIAVLAAAGSATSWFAARSMDVAAPVIAGEPSKSTLTYDPPLLGLALFLATVAGVAAVYARARLRR